VVPPSPLPSSPPPSTPLSLHVLWAAKDAKDWDKILNSDGDEFENEIEVDAVERWKSRIPIDMTYVPRNVKRQHENFVAIRQAGGKELTNDAYARYCGSFDDDSQVFWFVGKVARVSGVSVEDCVNRQRDLIKAHAAQLRPIELFPNRHALELWIAPGDSELDVAYNRPDTEFRKIEENMDESPGDLKKRLKANAVGFQGETYQGGEEGFRTWRLDDGTPARPQVDGLKTEEPDLRNASEEGSGGTRAPTDEELEFLQQKLGNRDLNALYEEQERRKKKGRGPK